MSQGLWRKIQYWYERSLHMHIFGISGLDTTYSQTLKDIATVDAAIHGTQNIQFHKFPRMVTTGWQDVTGEFSI
jgi:hypothetical protein